MRNMDEGPIPSLTLSIPRLEVIYQPKGGCGDVKGVWYQRLVLKDREGCVYTLTLSSALTTDCDPCKFVGKAMFMPLRPIQEARWNVVHLGVPGFVICDRVIEEIVALDDKAIERISKEKPRFPFSYKEETCKS